MPDCENLFSESIMLFYVNTKSVAQYLNQFKDFSYENNKTLLLIILSPNLFSELKSNKEYFDQTKKLHHKPNLDISEYLTSYVLQLEILQCEKNNFLRNTH